jgi:hypothetical protein
MADVDDFEQRLGSTIADFLPDCLVNRWVAVVEVIEDDGNRSLLTATSDDLRAWDTLGMLDWALERERTTVPYYLDSEDDDG